MDRTSGTLLLVLGIVLIVGGFVTIPVALWVSLWGGYGDSGGTTIGLWVLVVVLLGLGTAALAAGVRVRSRP